MKVEFRVEGLPPKKDGANSMWGKKEEAPKLQQLRIAALEALAGRPPLCRRIRLIVRAHIGPANSRRIGDLDNFITGICDGLQAADPKAHIAEGFDDRVHPSKAIAIADDVEVVEIRAGKVIAPEAPFYEVILEGE